MADSPLRLVKPDARTEPRKLAFTVKSLNALRPSTKRRWLYDSRCDGLAVMLTPTGSRIFYRTGRIKGRPQRVRIGAFPSVSIDQARKTATTMSGEVASGKDPSEHRRQQRGELTLRELWSIYCKDHAAIHCTQRTRTAEVSLWKVALSSLGSRKLSAVSTNVVANMHARIGTKRSKTTANRAVQLLRRLINYAAKHFSHEGPNPTRHVTLFREQSRERYLSADELPRFIEALDHEDEIFRDFFRLAILTAARRSNLQAMRWVDVDLTRHVWTIPGDESKNQTTMVVPLVAAGMSILIRRKVENDQRDQPSAHVFPAVRRKASPHMGQPIAAWRRICKRAGIRDLRIHDLRRTAGAWQAAGGTSLVIIARSLGHLDQRSTAVYARIDDNPVRESMERAAAAMFPSTQGAKA